MNNNINFLIIIIIIFFVKLLYANNLFESPFKKIEFQTNNIEDTKNYHINELKIFNFSNKSFLYFFAKFSKSLIFRTIRLQNFAF